MSADTSATSGEQREGADEVARVALDIAKWFINGDRPDEWKLKEWAEDLDPTAIDRAYEDRAALSLATKESQS